MNDIILFGIRDGLIWFPCVLGIGLIYTYFREIDISIDGNIILSAIVTAFVWRTFSSYSLSILAGVFTGILSATFISTLVSWMKVTPIMAGIAFSLVIHSISILLIGESFALPDTHLMGGMRDIPTILSILVVVVIFLTFKFYSTRLGVCIRKYGDGCELNTRYRPFVLRWLAYGFSGGLYGLGAALYAHSEGLAKSGSSFEFLVVSLCSFLAIDRFVDILEFAATRLRNVEQGGVTVATGWKQKLIILVTSPVAKSLVGSIVFAIIIFTTIAKTPNPILWKLIFSIILVLILIKPKMKLHKYQNIPDKNIQSTLLYIHNICVHYDIGPERRIVFDQANAEFPIGLTMIRGANGSGKSTMLATIAGLIEPTSGGMFYQGKNLLHEQPALRPVYIMHQDSMKTLAPHLTVTENLIAAFPRSTTVSIAFNHVIAHLNTTLEKDYNTKLLRSIGDSFWNKPVANLSGGEAQCVALYCALLSGASILLIDEPTTGLDDVNYRKLIGLLEALKKDRIILLTSHDTRVIKVADHIYTITDYNLERTDI